MREVLADTFYADEADARAFHWLLGTTYGSAVSCIGRARNPLVRQGMNYKGRRGPSRLQEKQTTVAGRRTRKRTGG